LSELPSKEILSPCEVAMESRPHVLTDVEVFTGWAKRQMRPLSAGWPDRELAAFGAMVGDATVVALSEPVHGAAEPLDFRNRILEYLVREKGFTAIAIESGVVEAREVQRFVRGGQGDLETVLAEGFSWRFGELPQNRSLVRWLRQYNTSPTPARQVNFYGFDVPGSPGHPRVRRGLDTALQESLRYLSRVDPVAIARIKTRAGSLFTHVRFDLCTSQHDLTYDKLNAGQRDILSASIADLVTLFERGAGGYCDATTLGEFEWAYRSALGARQVDTWLRQIPLGWQPATPPIKFPSPQTEFLAVANDVRDRAQADNLEWILAREGAHGKIVVFAHRYHISAAPVRAGWIGSRDQAVMGTHLRRRLGPRLLAVGALTNQGEVNCDGKVQRLNRATPESLDGILNALGPEKLLLDLRTAPVPIAAWLAKARPLSAIPLGEGHDAITLSIGEAFDVLFFVRSVTPA
jgi:erythromycin esterase